MNWLNILGLIVGPGGLFGGGWAILSGRKKAKADVAAQLTTSTLAWAKDMGERLDQAEQRVDVLESKLRARDTAVIKHMPWDWHVYAALKRLGEPVEEPPPLLPVEQHQ